VYRWIEFVGMPAEQLVEHDSKKQWAPLASQLSRSRVMHSKPTTQQARLNWATTGRWDTTKGPPPAKRHCMNSACVSVLLHVIRGWSGKICKELSSQHICTDSYEHDSLVENRLWKGKTRLHKATKAHSTETLPARTFDVRRKVTE